MTAGEGERNVIGIEEIINNLLIFTLVNHNRLFFFGGKAK